MRTAFRSMVPDFPEWFGLTPAVDVKKEEDKYLVQADMPGLTAEDIDINVKDNSLVISSKKEEKKEESDEGYLLKERRSSSFRRAFELPGDADKDKIEAKFDNGLLTLHIPRTGEEKAGSKKIEVKTGK
ncbi:MAG: Hsp20/alpha crystallin family protein [Spirochaetota bacterium]